MFAAAILYAAPKIELSIYSTCKRISQKLLRNVNKFFVEICDNDYEKHGFKIIRQNMEEIVLEGPTGRTDQRIVNSYPSKVTIVKMCMCVFVCMFAKARDSLFKLPLHIKVGIYQENVRFFFWGE